MSEMFDEYVPHQMDGVSDSGEFHDDNWGPARSGTSEPTISYINESGLRDEFVEQMLSGKRMRSEVASVVEKWSQSLAPGANEPSYDLFNRTKWKTNDHPFANISRCAWAVENDDILSTAADVTEGLMWQKVRFELFNEDEQSVWNQWAKTVNLDKALRSMGRELFKVSQFYVGLWWEKKTYTVQEDQIEETIKEFEAQEKVRKWEDQKEARDEYIAMNSHQPGYIEPPEIPEPEKEERRGNRRRKKKYTITVPTSVTIFDPTKIVPVGNLMFGRERFAYIADAGEHEGFASAMSGQVVDPTVMRLVERKYTPTAQDKATCADIGVDPNRLWLMREDAVFRHTLTKADYERFAPVRLKPILPILEMKAHLRNSDRAALIGSTNFIVVITKGSDKLPAKPAELANLQESARMLARIPVLIGDHRLKVEIVAPKIDNTLSQSRWEVLDSRLVFKALQTYSPVVQGGNSSGTGIKEMSQVIAKGMEGRRHMIVRSIESSIFQQVMDRNEEELDEFPTLAFQPRRITLDLSADWLNAVFKLHDRGDLSRETILEEADFDQDVEVLRRARERAQYDRVFESAVPFSSPQANPFGAPQPPQALPPGSGGSQPAGPGAGAPPAKKAAAKKVAAPEGGRPTGATDKKPRKKAGATT